jgi:hypothetical protein
VFPARRRPSNDSTISRYIQPAEPGTSSSHRARCVDHYRPGNEVKLDAGMHYEMGQGLNALLQLNGQYRSRDTGNNANPASGGGTHGA